jgi:hypothetical protein
MDPISIVVGSAISLLKPYVSKGAEEFIKSAGKDAYEQTKELFTWIKSKFNNSDEGSGLITLFESRPERYEAPFTELIEERAASDPQFSSELSEKVKSAAPYIHVVQKIDRAKDVTGVVTRELRKGTVEVNQDIGTGEDIVGVKVDRIGSIEGR